MGCEICDKTSDKRDYNKFMNKNIDPKIEPNNVQITDPKIKPNNYNNTDPKIKPNNYNNTDSKIKPNNYNNTDSKIKTNGNNNLITNNETVSIHNDSFNAEKLIEVKKESAKEKKRQIIGIRFLSTDQTVDSFVACKITDIFSYVLKKLYFDYPKLKNKNLFYLVNGSIVNTSATIEQNKIKHENCIQIVENEEEVEKIKIEPLSQKRIILIRFIFEQNEIFIDIACTPSDKFSTILQKLYHEEPELAEKKIVFLYNGTLIKRYATLEENGIEDDCSILIYVLDE